MKYARQWTEHANISFEVVSSGDAEIRVNFNEGGPLSYVGTSSLQVPQSKKTMNLVLNSWFSEESFARAALHGFGHALGLKHVHLINPSDILWDSNQPYSYYERTQGWSRNEVDVNVLNLLAADPGLPSSPRANSVMLYSVPASLTSNHFSVQGGNFLTPMDISLIGESFPSWNDLNVERTWTTHEPGSAVKNGTYQLKQAITPSASGVPNVALGVISVNMPTAGALRFKSSIETVTQSNIDLSVGTWLESRIHAASFSVFWATPSPSKPKFKTGTYSTNKAGQVINQRIGFGGPDFKTRPRVLVSLTTFDVATPFGVDVTVASIDRTGFIVNITSRGNLFQAGINWIAWPENEPGIDTGSFYEDNIVKDKSAKGDIELESVFDSESKVHFALGGFTTSSSYLQLTMDATVSKTSLSWSAKTWGDTSLSRVRGNYLVFKV